MYFSHIIHDPSREIGRDRGRTEGGTGRARDHEGGGGADRFEIGFIGWGKNLNVACCLR